MTIVNSVNGQVKPGRFEDHLAMGAEVVKLMDLMGARHPRLAMAIATGEPGGAFTFSTEYDNAEAWGEFSDRIAVDIEFQAFMARVRDANAPSTVSTPTVCYEIPLRDNNPARGNVIEVHVTRPVPGRFEKGLEEATCVLELVEDRGATNARVFQLGYAGMGSGMTMMTWEFENMRAHGRLADLWSTDPELAEIAVSSRFGAEASASPVWDGLYQVVPL
jgi:hypothetical protein